jgi:spore germination cell wall hydrolase CwlJ-like protein
MRKLLPVILLLFVTGCTTYKHAEARSTDEVALALNVYHEARGEPIIGQAAVARVTINRLKSTIPPFGKYRNLHDVVYDGGYGPTGSSTCQFQWTCDHINDYPRGIERYVRYVYDEVYPLALKLEDFDCVLYYHADDGRERGWVIRGGLKDPRKIGNHIFYNDRSC